MDERRRPRRSRAPRPAPRWPSMLSRRRAFSPTALQTFATCPYKFLLYAVHRLSPREAPEAIEELGPRAARRPRPRGPLRGLSTLREEGALPVTEANLDGASAPPRRRARRGRGALPGRARTPPSSACGRTGSTRSSPISASGCAAPPRTGLDPAALRALVRPPPAAPPRTRRAAATAVELDCGIRLRGSIDLVEQDASGALRATDYKTGRAAGEAGAVGRQRGRHAPAGALRAGAGEALPGGARSRRDASITAPRPAASRTPRSRSTTRRGARPTRWPR